MRLFLYITNVDDYLNGGYSFHAVVKDAYGHIDGWFLAGSVDFNPSVDEKEMRDYALGAIDNEEKETRAEFEVKMGLLKEKKASLLSITHQPLEVA